MTLGEKPKRSLWPLLLLVGVAVVVAGGIALALGRRVGGDPRIDISAPAEIGQRGELKVVVEEPVRGIVDVVVTVEGAGLSSRTVGEVHVPAPASVLDNPVQTRAEITASIGKAALPELAPGTLTVKVRATRAGTWLSQPPPATAERLVAVRLTPPSITPMSSFVHVAQGGAEAIVYEVGPTSVRDGVVVERKDGGAWEFPGSPLPGGPPTRRFALFAVPYDDDGPEADVKQRVRLFAEDALGNRATATFVHKFFPRPMGKDTIELTDPFLQKVTTEIFAQRPDLPRKGSLLQDYLVLNRDLRRHDNDFLVELSRTSRQQFLWSRVFQPFDNAAIRGAFADRRTYRYAGADVDTQDHLGFDLARVERSPVNAGNDGVVVFAGSLGIYGNCVVVDHGFGLMTLYAHLSSIGVREGDAVARGAILGTTGATGLAGGDHLHFTTLLHGRPTNPIEWWDAHWIGDRVKRKLGDALSFTDSDE